MILKLRATIIATWLLLALCASPIAVLAKGPALTGRLKTRENRPIRVNGNKSSSGATIFLGARIETHEGIGATVDLGVLGRLDIAPKSDLTLTFTEVRVAVEIKSGCAILTTKKGVTGSLQTPDGQTMHTDASKLSSVVGQSPGCAATAAGAVVVGGGWLGASPSMVGTAGSAIIGGSDPGTRNDGRGSNLSPTQPRTKLDPPE